MGGDVPESGSRESVINEYTWSVICECGQELSTDPSSTRVTCECGAMYTVTITQIREPLSEEPPAFS